MVCEVTIRRGQTRVQRRLEVRNAMAAIEKRLTAGKAKAVVDKRTGAIAFTGIDDIRDDVSDACVYANVMKGGATSAKLAIAKAEQLAGRTVSRAAVAGGVHGHADGHGGITWHHGH